jgi:ribose transport system substrate-binding protein
VTTFERRQQILRLLRDQPGIKVSELAKHLDVSEGTIRNDLAALDEEHLVMRVRGGAVARSEAHSWSPGWPPLHSEYSEHSDLRADSKQRIARWAAEIIENGDTILLDASNTVMYMAAFLRDHRNLTVVTNGIDVARRFAENISNTVILIGGILSSDGISVTGTVSEKLLNDLHVRRAFVSCSGFSVDTGLTEVDIRQAQIKSLMMRRAQEVIALVDSSKFGKVGITPFATIDQVSHIFTDSDVSADVIDQLREIGIELTVCEESTVSSFVPHQRGHHETQPQSYRIGFANLGEDMPFSVDVRRGLERALKGAANIDLIVADNQLNSEIALTNADDLIARGIDVMIEYQIDETIGGILGNKFKQANIPLIAVDIPIVGATFVGVDNYRSGQLAGTALGAWIREHWGGQIDDVIVLVEPRAGALPALRIEGQMDTLFSLIERPPADQFYTLNSGNSSEVTEAAMCTLLQELQHVRGKRKIAVLSFNDDAAYGAILAARLTQREDEIIIAGQGADRRVRELIRQPNSRIVGASAFMPEKYGEKLLDVALKTLRGEPLPPAVYIEPTFVDATNIDRYYPHERDL